HSSRNCTIGLNIIDHPLPDVVTLDVLFPFTTLFRSVDLTIAGHRRAIAGNFTVSAAVDITQTKGIGDIWPCLGHFKLPVLPAVNTRGAQLGDNINAFTLRTLDEGVGGHAGKNFQSLTS